MSRFVDGALRMALTPTHLLMRAVWFVCRPKTFGAHAIALTPEGKLILVKLRYASGWRIPGGGRSQDEEQVEAALRELREEIGMVSHGEARLARDLEEPTDFKRDTASLVIVRDVRYRPSGWNWEVERVCEADLRSLPRGTSAKTLYWLEGVRSLL